MAKILAAAGLTLASIAASAVLMSPTALAAETCKASYYTGGGTTASGERFDPNKLTAAHKTLPFGTKVKVKNRSNGKTVTVRINDRGPFITGRCVDLTPKAFKTIAPLSQGVVGVTVTRV